MAAFKESGFSRLPVYKGTLDHPQGLVLLKDLALQHGFGASGRFSLKRLLRPILYAPPSMPTGVRCPLRGRLRDRSPRRADPAEALLTTNNAVAGH